MPKLLRTTRRAKALILIVCFGLLQACATQQIVTVNAITDAAQPLQGKSYTLTSGMSQTPENDLYFQEFSRYFHYVLQKNGYSKASDKNAADIIIALSYNVSDPTTGIYHYSWPIYETFGGYSYTVTETTTDANGQQSTVKRNIYVPARTYQVGTEHVTRGYTVFTHNVSLVARDATQSDSEKPPLWNITVHSVDSSNDLRGLMPYLAAAASGYIGKNSGKQQNVPIDKDNLLLKELQGLLITPSR